jgi:hypothetical protein
MSPSDVPKLSYREALALFADPEGRDMLRRLHRLSERVERDRLFEQLDRLARDLQDECAKQGVACTREEAYRACIKAVEIGQPGRLARCGIRRRPTTRAKAPAKTSPTIAPVKVRKPRKRDHRAPASRRTTSSSGGKSRSPEDPDPPGEAELLWRLERDPGRPLPAKPCGCSRPWPHRWEGSRAICILCGHAIARVREAVAA